MLLRNLLWKTGLLLVAASTAVAASNSGITYHGRIMRPDELPLDGKAVQFKLQIRTPGLENCLLFEETQTHDMRDSGGVIAITINDGTGARTDGGTYNFDQIFSNRAPFSFPSAKCDSGTSTTIWTPNIADGRKFQVMFREDASRQWEPLPSAMMNFVPMAIESKQVGGFAAMNLLRVADGAGPAIAPTLSPANATELVALVNGNSVVYEKAGQLGGISIPASFSSGESIRWNGGAWEKFTPLTSYTETDPTVQAFAKAALPNCSAGQVLVSNGTTLSCVTDATGAAPSDATTSTKGVVAISSTGGIAVSSGTISLAASGVAAGTYTKVTVDTTGRVLAGAGLAASDIPSLDASKITSGTITVPVSISGNVSANSLSGRSIYVYDSDNSNRVTIQTPATATLTSDYVLTLPSDDGAAGEVLRTDGSGNLSWVAASAGSVTSVGLSLPSFFTVSGGPVTSSGTLTATLASQTANTIFAAPNGSAGAPSFRALASADIPALDAAKVTTGTFGSGQIPALDAGKITTGTFAQSLIPALSAAQIPSLDAGKITTGTFATALIPALDAGKITTGTFAAAQIPSLDAGKITTGTFAQSQIPALSAAQIPSLDAGKITTGTLASAQIPVLDASKVGTGTFAAAQIPSLDASKITTGTLAVPVNTTGMVGSRSLQVFDSDSTNKVTIVTPATGSLTADYTLTLPVDDGINGQVLTTNGSGALTWSSAAIGSVTSVDVNLPNIFTLAGGPITSAGTISATLASQAANSFWAAPNGSAGAPTFRAMVAADVPALDAAKVATGTFASAQIPALDAAKITTGTFAQSLIPALSAAQIPNLDAAKITTGTFATALIPALDAAKITSGTFATAQIPVLTSAHIPSLDAGKITTGTFAAAQIPGLDAAKITTGTFATAQIPVLTAAHIPSLDAGKITTGTFAQSLIPALSSAQIPNLDAAKITTGTFATSLIPALDAAKITSGTFATAQIPVLTSAHIPALDAAKITSGTFATAQIPVLTAAHIPALDAAKIATGTFATAQIPVLTAAHIPALDAAKITTGTLTNTLSNTTSVSTRSIQVFDSDSSNKVTIVTPATGSLTSDYVLTLPVDDGVNGQILSTDGSGNLAWVPAGGTGTVTNVGLTLPSIFSVAGGPITTNGTFTATLASQTQNTFWAAPNGSSGAPTFRAMVAADVPALDAAKITTGTFATAQIPALDAAKITSGTFTTSQIPTLTAGHIPALDAGKITTGTFSAAQVPALDAAKITTGTFATAQIPVLTAAHIPSLDAGKITTGTFAQSLIPALSTAQIPNLDAAKITSGTFATSLIPALDAAKITSGTFATAQIPLLTSAHIPSLDAAKITTGTFASAQIPVLTAAHIPALDAAKITTGTFATAQIPSLDAAKITTGTFATAQIPTLTAAHIPSLDAAKITTGTFTAAQIPALDAAKITTGTFAAAQIPAHDASKVTTGTITTAVSNTSLVGTRSVQVFDSDSTNKVTIVTPATGSLTADYQLTLPVDDGTANQVLQTDGSGVLSWTSAATGTVTNVGLTLPNIFSVSGGPVTSNGTFTATLASQTQNTFWAAPNGSSGAPTFRAMVAADVPALDAAKISTGTFTAAQIPALDAAKITTGTFATAQIPTLTAAHIPALDAAKITTGTFTAAQIPALDAAKITTGTIATPGMVSGAAITSGTIGGSTAIATNGAISAVSMTSKGYNIWDSDASNSILLQTPATGTLTSNYVLTLPADNGNAGQVLSTDGSGVLSWVDGLTTALADGSIFVGNGSGVATAVAPSGDVSMTNAGAFTVTKLQGKPVSSATIADGQFMRVSSGTWTPSTIGTSDLPSSVLLNGGNNTAAAMTVGTTSNQALTFKTGNNDRMTLDTSGNMQFVTYASGFNWTLSNPFNRTRFTMDTFTNSATAPILTFRKGRNLSNTSPTVAQVNDSLGALGAKGYAGNMTVFDDTTWNAGFDFRAAETHSGTGYGTKIQIYTTKDQTTTKRLHGIFDSNGRTGFNHGAPGASVDVVADSNTHLSAATAIMGHSVLANNDNTGLNATVYPVHTTSGTFNSIGVASFMVSTMPAGQTNWGEERSFLSQAVRNIWPGQTDSGTLNNLYGAQIQFGHSSGNGAANPTTNNTIGIMLQPIAFTGAIGSQYDIWAQDVVGGATITNRYGIAIDGTGKKNYMMGNVGVGTNNPTAKLEVAGTTKLGSSGTAFSNMGVCTVAAFVLSNSAVNQTCTGIPASTSVAVNCSPTGAFSAAGTTVMARATGTANQIALNTSAINSNSLGFTCMWMQP